MLTPTATRHAHPARHSALPSLFADQRADKGPKHCAYEASAGHGGPRALERLLQQDRKR